MGKTTKGAAKTAAKIAKGKAKVARKCGKAAKAVAVALFASALFAAGCMGTTTPSRSQTLCIKDCTISVYGCGTETNEVPRIELATQAMSIENSGTRRIRSRFESIAMLGVTPVLVWFLSLSWGQAWRESASPGDRGRSGTAKLSNRTASRTPDATRL